MTSGGMLLSGRGAGLLVFPEGYADKFLLLARLNITTALPTLQAGWHHI